MSKYLIKFEKLGLIRYTSHLDMQRLFQRALKRANISLDYSHGFNPHPKMSFAQPLSLGYSSVGEYLEFDTTKDYDNDSMIRYINETMPTGIKITDCWSLPDSKKTVAAIVSWGSYEIIGKGNFIESTNKLIEQFLKQDQIMVNKRQKKDGKMAETDIRSMILEVKVLEEEDGQIKLYAMVRAGSKANLNPELLIKAFYDFANVAYEIELISITRLDLFNDELSPLYPC